jgi:PAS domain S-box-containing protein
VSSQDLSHRVSNTLLLVAVDSRRAAHVKQAFALASPARDVEVVKGIDQALRRLDVQAYDVVILDRGQLSADGLEALLEICTRTSGAPVLVLTDLGCREAETRLSTTSPCYTVFTIGGHPESLPGVVARALHEHPLALGGGRGARGTLEEDRVLAVIRALLDSPTRATGPDGVLARVTDAALLAVPHACGAEMHLLDEETGLLVARSASPPNLDTLRASGLLEGHQLGELLSGESDAIYVPDAKQSSILRGMALEARSLLVLPLVAAARVVGTLSLSSEQVDAFDAKSQLLLTALARQAAMAVEASGLRHRLRRSEETCRSIMEGARDAICLVDLESWRLLEINRQGEKLIGRSLNQVTSITADDVVFTREKEGNKITLRELVASDGSSFENLSLVRRDGRLAPVSVRVDPVPHADTAVVRVAMHDFRVRKELEEELIQSEKLAALGRLAVSLAHEMNNPLQALSGSVGLLAKGPVDEGKRARYVEIASKQVERLIHLVQGMLDFYRPARETRELVNVNLLLEDTLALASKQLDHRGIEVAKELSPGLGSVEAVASHLRQVFMNLVLFHVEAMPHGGHLTVRTCIDEDSEQLIICFSDTGDGIPPGDLPHIFEPFYCTKETTGDLGMAVGYSIVEQHGGCMEVSSQAGTGTAFTVKLPLGGARSA